MKYSLSIIVVLLLLLSGCAVHTSSSGGSRALSSTTASSDGQSSSSSSTGSSESEHIYACNGQATLSDKTYAVEVVQTEVVAPDTEKYPLSGAVGKFDLIIRDGTGKGLHRQNLNALYHDKTIGFWGVGYKDQDKINFIISTEKDKCIFGIPVGHGEKDIKKDQQGTATVIFSLDKTGAIKVMPVKDGYVYAENTKNHLDFVDTATINRFKTIVNGGEYVWDGNQYVLAK